MYVIVLDLKEALTLLGTTDALAKWKNPCGPNHTVAGEGTSLKFVLRETHYEWSGHQTAVSWMCHAPDKRH